MKKLIILTLVISGTFSACKKKDETTPASKSKTELITAHYWKLSAFTVNPPIDVGGTQVTDVYDQLEACTKDDLIKFNTDKTYIEDEGATKCDPSDPQTYTSTWNFNSTETIVTVDGSDMTIVNLSDNELKCTFKELYDGINYTYTIVYVKN
jgi:hypothetical protein